MDFFVTEDGYQQGTHKDFNREHALDLTRLCAFIEKTQLSCVKTSLAADVVILVDVPAQ